MTCVGKEEKSDAVKLVYTTSISFVCPGKRDLSLIEDSYIGSWVCFLFIKVGNGRNATVVRRRFEKSQVLEIRLQTGWYSCGDKVGGEFWIWDTWLRAGTIFPFFVEWVFGYATLSRRVDSAIRTLSIQYYFLTFEYSPLMDCGFQLNAFSFRFCGMG